MEIKEQLANGQVFFQITSGDATTTGTGSRTSIESPGADFSRLYSAEQPPGGRVLEAGAYHDTDHVFCKATSGSNSLFAKPAAVIRPPPGRPAGTWRQSRYVLPSEDDSEDILIRGWLREQGWFFGWHRRWCVLRGQALEVYQDEQSWKVHAAPLKVIDTESIVATHSGSFVGEEAHTFRCIDKRSHQVAAAFKAGPGGVESRWEEIVAMKLWMAAVNTSFTRPADPFFRRTTSSSKASTTSHVDVPEMGG
eukprot:TRINITY_DN51793_c0_g1_i1.p1 TRINITY_DN51793_c0_g1~~TRINITY_DN51793_c0_g1_i1.p1  ORF type:complete len:251 (+),score=49.30 TRINITY_DN51793_c0_g1_i1:86-838(+)